MATSSNPQTSVQPDPKEADPAVKMKHYIRDIMGEDSPEHGKI